jgi:hypothetical protein
VPRQKRFTGGQGNGHFDNKEILRGHQAATVGRFAGEKVIPAVRDTTSLNYDRHEKTEGIGYIGDKTKGVNIHSCIAVTTDGLVLGVLDQTHYNRPQAKDDTMTAEVKKNRPIEEKESNRWLVMMEEVCRNIPDEIKVINVCDREGDIYELFDKAVQNNLLFLIRIVQNRMTVENERILDEIRQKPCVGRINTVIPRDSRHAAKAAQIPGHKTNIIARRDSYA